MVTVPTTVTIRLKTVSSPGDVDDVRDGKDDDGHRLNDVDSRAAHVRCSILEQLVMCSIVTHRITNGKCSIAV